MRKNSVLQVSELVSETWGCLALGHKAGRGSYPRTQAEVCLDSRVPVLAKVALPPRWRSSQGLAHQQHSDACQPAAQRMEQP